MATQYENFLNKTKVGKIFKELGDDVYQQVDANISAASAPYLGGSLGPSVANPFDQDPVVDFSKTNSSFSGTDCSVFVQLNNKLILLGNLQTFSHSIHREKVPVRVLGRSYPKGFTSGGLLIAGSMIFIVFDRAPFYDVIKEINYVKSSEDRYTSPIPSQLPPLDLILLYNNEYGHHSLMKLFGVEFVDEGQVTSINDLYSECTMSYVARDMDQMISFSDIGDFKNMLFERQMKGQFIDNYSAGLFEYKIRIEREINECNEIINSIDMETDRRAVAGVFTLSASYWLSKVIHGKSYVTREDLNNEKNKQLKIKKYLLGELEKTNSQIEFHRKSITGWNAQNSDNGIAATDYISHAPTTPR